MTFDMILGNDTLLQFDNLKINYRKNNIEIPQLGIFKFINSEKAILEENTIIEPNSEKIIFINTKVKSSTAFFVKKINGRKKTIY